ncbi:MAG: glycosyltransferase family 4 protein [Candidatus Aminicenantes bacterium]|jgi:glycosyltransferase involved in cell wall biosynthesis
MPEKIRVINVFPGIPAYEAYRNSPRPKINWDTSNGSWVGIWGYDWSDLLGEEILKISNDFEYEVWQPDLRADKVYSHCFDNGLIHKLFPAEIMKSGYFPWKHKTLNSSKLNYELIKIYNNKKIIIHLNEIFDTITKFFLNKIEIKRNPVFISAHGSAIIPQNRIFATKNLLKSLAYINSIKYIRRMLKKVDIISEMRNDHIEDIKHLYKGKIIKMTMGVDFEFWRNENKEIIRKKLGLKDRKIFLCASNLIPRKQVDKIIQQFISLKDKYDFLLIIAGHGSKQYEKYLIELAKPLINSKKIQFVGYKIGNELKDFYNASDLFISTSIHEGASVAIMKAFACQTPVLSSNVGGTFDLMKDLNVNFIVDKSKPDSWIEPIEKFLKGYKPKSIDYEIAKGFYHWPTVAKRYIELYLELFYRY